MGTCDKAQCSVFRIGISGKVWPQEEGRLQKDDCRVQMDNPSVSVYFFNLQSLFCLPVEWVPGPSLCVSELLYHGAKRPCQNRFTILKQNDEASPALAAHCFNNASSPRRILTECLSPKPLPNAFALSCRAG